MRRLSSWGVVLACVLAAASTASANSRYSLRGNGESVQSKAAAVRATGGAEGASTVPSISGNPASLSFADRTRFSGTYETQWVRTQQSSLSGGGVRRDYQGMLPNLSLVYPLPAQWALGVGLLVDRRTGGTIERDAMTSDGQEYRQVFEAKGNVLRFPVVAGRSVGSVAIGLGLDVVLLNHEARWRNDFADNSGFLDSDDLDVRSLWGVDWRAGVRVPLGSRVALGAWGTLPSNLDGSRRLENDDPFDNTDDLKVDLSGELASTYAASVEVAVTPKIRAIADWVHENWTDATAFSAVDTSFVDVDRIALGVEYTPEEGRGGLRWPWRLGFRTEKLHVLDGFGEEVRENFVTGGSGFGLAGGRGQIDWYVEYGWRGDTDATEYREQIVRVGVTLTGVETWSKRRRPEDDDW